MVRHFEVSGPLDFVTVIKWWNSSLSYLINEPEYCFDFTGVTSSNSAALALMLEWVRYASKVNKTIQLKAIPQQLLSIAEVSGVSHVLSISIS